MSFSTAERTALLALKGVGPTVLQRLEQMGLDSFVRLRDSDAASILA
ncbi:TPA: helix-hairpin-helix domain-containing protein, partial [Pseudomonas aeruginosa]|nr:helix-hairpin-helix domain-containing protein [Pseudomonas aeruginosa]